MIRHLSCVAVVSLSLMAIAHAQQPRAPDSQPVERQVVKIPGTDVEVVYYSGATAPDRIGHDALLTAIATWLSASFDLPATPHPRIVIASGASLPDVRDKALLSPQSSTAQHDVMGLYFDTEHTIYLPEGWTGDTPADMSVLVHEMVHHLQNRGGVKYECPQAREAPAYAAQQRWLRLSGHDLESDFGLDPFSLLVKTRCGY